MTLLHIDASILDHQSVSRQLTATIVERLTEGKPGIQVVRTDLDLSAAEFLAFQGVEPQDEATKQQVARNEQFLTDFLAAEIVVIGAPMYNFSLPNQLKAWLGRIAVAGKTFRYSATGVEGFAGGKRVIVASTRGGLFSEGAPAADLDHQETYLRGIFGFVGINDVTFVRAEGLALGDETRKAAVATAIAQVEQLAA